METKEAHSLRQQPNRVKKCRDKMRAKGRRYYQFQVTESTFERFEKLVEARADEMVEPFDQRRREAKARTQLFDELTQEVIHQFFLKEEQIESLKNEISILSPSFFKSNNWDKTPLPAAIDTLPDDSIALKNYLATLHIESIKDKKAFAKSKTFNEKYRGLYEAQVKENERLKQLYENEG